VKQQAERGDITDKKQYIEIIFRKVLPLHCVLIKLQMYL
jgi:hypothetical protein